MSSEDSGRRQDGRRWEDSGNGEPSIAVIAESSSLPNASGATDLASRPSFAQLRKHLESFLQVAGAPLQIEEVNHVRDLWLQGAKSNHASRAKLSGDIVENGVEATSSTAFTPQASQVVFANEIVLLHRRWKDQGQQSFCTMPEYRSHEHIALIVAVSAEAEAASDFFHRPAVQSALSAQSDSAATNKAAKKRHRAEESGESSTSSSADSSEGVDEVESGRIGRKRRGRQRVAEAGGATGGSGASAGLAPTAGVKRSHQGAAKQPARRLPPFAADRTGGLAGHAEAAGEVPGTERSQRVAQTRSLMQGEEADEDAEEQNANTAGTCCASGSDQEMEAQVEVVEVVSNEERYEVGSDIIEQATLALQHPTPAGDAQGYAAHERSLSVSALQYSHLLLERLQSEAVALPTDQFSGRDESRPVAEGAIHPVTPYLPQLLAFVAGRCVSLLSPAHAPTAGGLDASASSSSSSSSSAAPAPQSRGAAGQGLESIYGPSPAILHEAFILGDAAGQHASSLRPSTHCMHCGSRRYYPRRPARSRRRSSTDAASVSSHALRAEIGDRRKTVRLGVRQSGESGRLAPVGEGQGGEASEEEDEEDEEEVTDEEEENKEAEDDESETEDDEYDDHDDYHYHCNEDETEKYAWSEHEPGWTSADKEWRELVQRAPQRPQDGGCSVHSQQEEEEEEEEEEEQSVAAVPGGIYGTQSVRTRSPPAPTSTGLQKGDGVKGGEQDFKPFLTPEGEAYTSHMLSFIHGTRECELPTASLGSLLYGGQDPTVPVQAPDGQAPTLTGLGSSAQKMKLLRHHRVQELGFALTVSLQAAHFALLTAHAAQKRMQAEITARLSAEARVKQLEGPLQQLVAHLDPDGLSAPLDQQCGAEERDACETDDGDETQWDHQRRRVAQESNSASSLATVGVHSGRPSADPEPSTPYRAAGTLASIDAKPCGGERPLVRARVGQASSGLSLGRLLSPRLQAAPQAASIDHCPAGSSASGTCSGPCGETAGASHIEEIQGRSDAPDPRDA